MTAFFQAISGLAPDAQLVLALCIFTVVIVVAVSSDAKQRICEFLVALAHVFHPGRKPPKKPPTPGAV
jgi:arginyl-tRNA synthetase